MPDQAWEAQITAFLARPGPAGTTTGRIVAVAGGRPLAEPSVNPPARATPAAPSGPSAVRPSASVRDVPDDCYRCG